MGGSLSAICEWHLFIRALEHGLGMWDRALSVGGLGFCPQSRDHSLQILLWWNVLFPSLYNCWCCSVAQSCPTLCDSMDCSTPGFPALHHLLELAKIHVYWVSDAIPPSHPLLPPSPPAHNLSQHQGLFQWVSSSHQTAYASTNVKSVVSLTSLLSHQFSYGGGSPPESLENIFSLREYAQKHLPSTRAVQCPCLREEWEVSFENTCFP